VDALVEAVLRAGEALTRAARPTGPMAKP
jgi:hypothetical protein